MQFYVLTSHIELNRTQTKIYPFSSLFHSRKQGGVRSIIVPLTCILVIDRLLSHTHTSNIISLKLSYTLFCRKVWQTSWIFQSPRLIFAIDFGLNSESKLHAFSYFMAEFVILNKVNNKIRIRVNNLNQPPLFS